MSEVKRFEMEKEYSLDINIVPTEYPDGSFVHYDDYAALQEQLAHRDAQIAALTAENVALKVQTPDARSAEMFEAIEKAEEFFEVGCPELALIEAFEILKLKSTPATDAAANALRAEGVEMAISQSFMDGIPVNRMQFIARMTAFANQLREGK